MWTFTLEDLKSNKKDIIEKIAGEHGRNGVISFCANVLDKRAYFTVDMNGKIKRKKMSYAIPASVLVNDDKMFIDCVADSIDFTEKTKIEKLERMNNIEDVKKNIFKLIVKGDCHFALKYCKELCMRNKEEFLKMMFTLSLMDNISFEKSLAVYSMKKYFEKYGYSDEVLYLTISYLAKMRADFSEYENECVKYENKNSFGISKEELREQFKNNIEKYKTEKGLEILGYLAGLLAFDNYDNEEIFIAILKKKMETFEKGILNDKILSEVSEEIFKNLSKEV